MRPENEHSVQLSLVQLSLQRGITLLTLIQFWRFFATNNRKKDFTKSNLVSGDAKSKLDSFNGNVLQQHYVGVNNIMICLTITS